LSCDAAQIEQVLIALTMNAIDAMPKGGTLWLETGMADDQKAVEIKVRDDGTGISPEVLPNIFEPFLTTKESGHGVGLGLAIAKGIVERHSGRIEVQSTLGQGTTFIITLPVEIPSTSLSESNTKSTDGSEHIASNTR
jgi:signal transduction histidine kinase